MLCGYCNKTLQGEGPFSGYIEPPVMLCGYCNRVLATTASEECRY